MARDRPGDQIRRSGRQRQPRRYTLDAFDGVDIGSDIAGSSSDDDPAIRRSRREEQEDGEFGMKDAMLAEEALDDNIEGSRERFYGNYGDEVGDDTITNSADISEREDESFGDTDDEKLKHKKRKSENTKPRSALSARQVPVYEAFDPTNIAIPPIKPTFRSARPRHLAHETRLKGIFGEEDRDLIPPLKYRDSWQCSKNLPNRVKDKWGQGGFEKPFVVDTEQFEKESYNSWNWYREFGKEQFRKFQTSNTISDLSGRQFINPCTIRTLSCLQGSHQRQELFEIQPFDAIKASEGWKQETGLKSRRRDGWILNAGGGKINALKWCPNRDGTTQYLAVTTAEVTKDEKAPDILLHISEAMEDVTNRPVAEASDPRKAKSAFEAAEPTPSAIQIWAVNTASESFDPASVNMDQKPHLLNVICGVWGTIRHIEWCPIPRESKESDEERTVSLGLLAIISSDGNLRVLDVYVQSSFGQIVEWRLYDEVAFCTKPKHTIATCVTWLSSCMIAIGCSSGSVAIYDIAELLSPVPQSSRPISPRPFFNHVLHYSYVLAITCGYPSRPHLIFTSSVSGYTRVTDILAPDTDTLLSNRVRFAPTQLVWSEALQGIFHLTDDHTVRLSHWRNFSLASVTAKLGANPASVAVGTAHPHILIGGSDGSVTVLNPLRKFWYVKGPLIQLMWFWHEWSGRNNVAGGVSRIVEGFKAEKKVDNTSTKHKVILGHHPLTLYDEATAITAVCWNPNVSYGGWAAVGAGSGLVRVEDLAC